uniref:F-box domain-containing protein n=1 Tax=Amphora coffeiformis TaxID=265554 RepID=A0A7S3L5C1_9STRA
MSSSAVIESLPPSIYFHILSFLEPYDGAEFSACSRSLHQSIPLSSLDPIDTLPEQSLIGGIRNGDDFVRWYRLPIWMPRVHSLILKCNWADQGWGNRKGRLAVVAFSQLESGQVPPARIPAHHDTDQPAAWGGGRLVYLTPQDAPHQREALRATIPHPTQGESFFVFARAGGGGGHEIRVSDVSLQTIIFDKEDRCTSKTFKAMNAAGFLEKNHPTGFGLDLLGIVIKMLLDNHPPNVRSNPLCAKLLSLLEDNGFSVTLDSLIALEEIRHGWESEKALGAINFANESGDVLGDY